MNFKEFFKDVPLLQALLMECVLFERDNDDKFRDNAMKITEFIIDNVNINKAHNFQHINLFIEFQELPKYVKANYAPDERTITINILNGKNTFETNIKQFMQDNKYALFHEVVHVLDYARGSKFRANPQGAVSQINSPAEFNAYFHTFVQILEDATQEVARSGDRNEAFEKYIGSDIRMFMKGFWEKAKVICKDDETKIVSDILGDIDWKYRWDKRLYQFYFEIKEKLLDKVNKQKLKQDKKDCEVV
jgi:hypothetical protein